MIDDRVREYKELGNHPTIPEGRPGVSPLVRRVSSSANARVALFVQSKWLTRVAGVLASTSRASTRLSRAARPRPA